MPLLGVVVGIPTILFAFQNLFESEEQRKKEFEYARTHAITIITDADPEKVRKRAGQGIKVIETECVEGIVYTKYGAIELALMQPNGNAQKCNKSDSITYKEYFGDYGLRCIHGSLYIKQLASRRYGGSTTLLYDHRTGKPQRCEK
ncbi:hypothetical protein AB6D66_00980 [Vibrio pomeroyi]|uniref:Uncharacterized protein n=1 Tax=Vibrio pomeroyi TaxID=198832 RepID=A0ABV4MR70_9VIBR|nr:hypothetical protein [Vibrio atlanticus]MCZ4310303.1 hypothetical protein [Vibrio atlanticus]